MKIVNGTPRAGPDEFISILARNGHTTVEEIHQMFAVCILCKSTATVAVVSVDRHTWFRRSKFGKLRVMIYGLCDACFALPDAAEKAKAVVAAPFSKFVH